MDILSSINKFDLLVVLFAFGMFVLGYVQGTIRRVLGLASMLFSFYVAGAKEGEATVFSSPPSNSKQMVVDNREGARLGIAIANDTNSPIQYEVLYRTGSTVLATLLEIPARSSVARFLDEVLAVVPNSVGDVSIFSAQPLSAIGLRFTGGVFTTIPSF